MKKPKSYKPKGSGAPQFFSDTRKEKYNEKDWVKYRFRFLRYNPLCYCCAAPSRHVDHIVSAVERPDLFENLQNHLPMCVSCHSVVTAKFDKIKPQDIEGKMKWIQDKREKHNLKTTVKVMPYYKRIGG